MNNSISNTHFGGVLNLEFTNDLSHDFIIFETERLAVERESMKLFNECILYFESMDDEIELYGEGVLSKIKDGVVNIAKKIWKFIINFIKGAVRLITKPFGIRFKWALKDDDSGGGGKGSGGFGGGGGSSSPSTSKAKKNNDNANTNIFSKEYINPSSNGFLSFEKIKIKNVFSVYSEYMKTIQKEANKTLNQSDNVSFSEDEVTRMLGQYNGDKKKLDKVQKVLNNSMAFKSDDIKTDDDIINVANKNIKANLEIDKIMSNRRFQDMDKYISISDLNDHLVIKDLNVIETSNSKGSVQNSEFRHGFDLLSVFFENIITYIENMDGEEDIIPYSKYINNNFNYTKSSDGNLKNLKSIVESAAGDKINYNSQGYKTTFLKDMVKLEDGNFTPLKIENNKENINTIKKATGIQFRVTQYGGSKNPTSKIPERSNKSQMNIEENKTIRLSIQNEVLNPAINKLNKIEGSNGKKSVEKNVKENNNFSSVKANLTDDLNMLKKLLNGIMKATNDIIKFLTLMETSERSALLYTQLLAFDYYMKRMMSLYIQITGLKNIDEYPKLKGLKKNLKSVLNV